LRISYLSSLFKEKQKNHVHFMSNYNFFPEKSDDSKKRARNEKAALPPAKKAKKAGG
jgi:23S rRNA maturation mini-RNase III